MKTITDLIEKSSLPQLFIIICLLSSLGCKKEPEQETPPPQNPGTVTDIDGNVYNTIVIGNQVWMAENLKVRRYRNGDPILNVQDTTWDDLTTGAYCDYENNVLNGTVYGHLYNGFAVEDNRNLAPAGWHVATTEDWSELVNFHGQSGIAGGKLKQADTTHWSSPNTGANNESGFTALPGGSRSIQPILNRSEFEGLYQSGSWHRMAPHATYPAHLRFNTSQFTYLAISYKVDGFSVRCVKD